MVEQCLSLSSFFAEAAAVLNHRGAWTAELAKQLENLPGAFRALLQNPNDEQALLDALHASLRKREASEPAGDLLSGGLRSQAPAAPAEAPDLLGGGLGAKRSLLKRKADEDLLGSKTAKPGKRKAALNLAPKAAPKKEARTAEWPAYELLAWSAEVDAVEDGGWEETAAQQLLKDAPRRFIEAAGSGSPAEVCRAAQRLAAQNLLGKPAARHSDAVPTEEMLQYGLAQTMVQHERFPTESCAELVHQLTALKGDPEPEVLAQLALKQRTLVAGLVSAQKAVPLGRTLAACAAARNPSAAAVKAVLENVPKVLRLMLNMSAPSKYEKQKNRLWKDDLRTASAIYEVCLQAHLEKLLTDPVAEEASPEAEREEGSEGEPESEVDPADLQALAENA